MEHAQYKLIYFIDFLSRCCAYVLRISGYSSFRMQYFGVVYDYVEKAEFCKSYQNPKRKFNWGNHSSFRDN